MSLRLDLNSQSSQSSHFNQHLAPFLFHVRTLSPQQHSH